MEVLQDGMPEIHPFPLYMAARSQPIPALLAHRIGNALQCPSCGTLSVHVHFLSLCGSALEEGQAVEDELVECQRCPTV